MKALRTLILSWASVTALLVPLVRSAGAQESPAPTSTLPANNVQQPTTPAPPVLRLTLEDALARARKNSPQFLAAQTDAAIARQDRYQAAAALLPTVTYNNEALYTQLGTGNNVRFIANNAAHEYVSQANVHETIDLLSVSNYRRASAASALAKARAEIAAKKNGEEGDGFLKLTQDPEKGGEVAHSDVIKAELQVQDRHRQLLESQLGLLNARLDFAVLVFPDFNDNFELAEDLHASVPLPTLAEVQQRAARDNPDLRAALAAVQQAGHDVTGARAGYLPSLSFDYWYGIDAPQFAVDGPNGVPNLGSSAAATVNIPIWNWGVTQSRVKQAELRRTQAQRELSLAQRKLLAEIKSLYAEADTALNELSGLSRASELSGESLRLTTLRYKGGEATVLEVVDAQTTFAQTNAAYQDGALRYRVALANLQTLTGVLTTP
ncbi:MAG: TolC family protein [Acidobacteria bacterium]|nr:MAG: TolC family protein [Acidobacteriota bacterium]